LPRLRGPAEPRLDVLVNNAGIGDLAPGGGRRQESADGIELVFAVNYLAGYALSRLPLPLLVRSAPSRADDQAYDLEARRRLRALSDELTGLG
jgi:NAD(P)-dependent dehydrogenase (short-subunit alcohol dehydrogenase family)